MHENFLNNRVKFPEKAAIRLAATFFGYDTLADMQLLFKQLILSPKPVNYEYERAIISNNEYCHPNQ